MSQNVIEFNGKRYDASTGAYLGKSYVIPKHITEHYARGKVIDGFVRPTRPAQHTTAVRTKISQQTTPIQKETPTPSTSARQPHVQAAHIKAHKPERAKTLIRRAIKKPEYSVKPAIKTQAPAEILTKQKTSLMHKRSAYGVDPIRKQRAAQTGRHHTIRHFTNPTIHAVSAQVVPVQSAPLRLTPRALQPIQKHTDIFEAAIAHATSHTQPKHKVRRHLSKKRRLVNSLAIVATFLIIGGFIGYLNLPQLQVRVASIRAGFGASLPGYTPTGYALEDGVAHSGGTVSLSFRSGDSRFQITQQASNWNSQTLLDNTLALGGEHQTVQRNGQTIYIYDKNGTNAAWVNGGVRYDITGNAQLSKDEIASIATSL